MVRVSADDERRAVELTLGACDLCHRPVRGHDVAILGSVVRTQSGESEAALDAAVSRGDWREAARPHEFRGDADEVVYYAIRCASSGAIGLKRLLSFAEMWADDTVTAGQVLDPEASAKLLSVTSLEWSRG
jgi:hypothetical protein